MERYEHGYQFSHLVPSYLLKVDARNKFAGKSFEIKPTGQHDDECGVVATDSRNRCCTRGSETAKSLGSKLSPGR
jgi:hypothetical protein